MNLLQDRRTLLWAGVAGAVLVAVVAGAVIAGRSRAPKPQASTRSLQVEIGEQPRFDPNRQLRCFVAGQLIGTATLAECARRNGVTAQSLDVGLDETGALAAGAEALQPLPQVASPATVAVSAPPPPPAALQPPPVARTQAPVGECLRYASDGWQSTGGALTLSACVQALFAGRCERPGDAAYGRWSGQTLRLVPGRVETSNDNREFRTLAEQGRDCSIPPL